MSSHPRGLSTIRHFILAFLLISASAMLSSQEPNSVPDSLGLSQIVDSLSIPNAQDTALIGKKVIESADLEQSIFYDARDSIIFDVVGNRLILVNEALVKFGDLELSAGRIVYDFAKNTASATGIPDSTGTLSQLPLFVDGDQKFTQTAMEYNFESGKALIKQVVTQDGEIVLHAEKAKRLPNEWINIKDGKFTTCDADNPHYHFHITKGTVIPNDKVVTGPVYLKVRKVPLPLGLPFGFFPNQEKRSHGLIIPGYGDAQSLGFFLKELGYYVPIKDFADTRILFDVYSGGSWAAKNITRYRKRYNYNGNFTVSYNRRLNGFPEFPDFSRTIDYNVNWTHTQDSKARPGTTFRASVNAGTTTNFTNNLNSSVDQFLQGQLNSSIAYSKQFKSSNISLAARHTQNNQTGAINFTLPDLAYTINRFFLPLGFLGNTSASKKDWSKKIGITNSFQYQNLLATSDSTLALNNLDQQVRDFRMGAKHTLRANANFKVGYMNINPNFTHTSFLNFKQLGVSVDPETGLQSIDTLNVPTLINDWSFGVNATTKIYTFINYTKSERIKALRYLMTPTFGFNFNPFRDLTTSGYFGPDGELASFTKYDLGILGRPSQRGSGRVTFGVNNNLELKVRDGKANKPDATKKIKLIESLNLNTSYDLFRDSLNMADFRFSGFTNFTKNIRLNYNANYSPYVKNEDNVVVNEFVATSGTGLARFTNANFSLTANLRSGDKSKRDKEPEPVVPVNEADQEFLDQNRQDFVDWSLPWNMSITYNYGLRANFDPVLGQDTIAADNHNVRLSGDVSIMERWKIGYQTGIDVVRREITTTSLNLYWDLHCWEASFNIIPFGQIARFSFQLNIKSALLKDLKLQQRGNFSGFNGQW